MIFRSAVIYEGGTWLFHAGFTATVDRPVAPPCATLSPSPQLVSIIAAPASEQIAAIGPALDNVSACLMMASFDPYRVNQGEGPVSLLP
jgi:hypothetical protein